MVENQRNLSCTADCRSKNVRLLYVVDRQGTYLLREGFLEGGQGSVCVTGVSLQRFDPVLQVSQLLVFVSQLLLQVLNLASKD